LGATANFSKVLEMASGEFFMWLGDDDWIDASYVGSCLRELIADKSLALVSGSPQYYRNGLQAFESKRFNLLQKRWWLRVLLFYVKVSDNGMFYGLMHTKQIRQINLLNTMGGDWLIVAGLSSFGKIKTLPDIYIHRELGGATKSYSEITRSLGLSKKQAFIQGVFPLSSISASAWIDIVMKGAVYHNRPSLGRLTLGSTVFCLILLKRFLGYGKKLGAFIIKMVVLVDYNHKNLRRPSDIKYTVLR
jgi:hypothetical protein